MPWRSFRSSRRRPSRLALIVAGSRFHGSIRSTIGSAVTPAVPPSHAQHDHLALHVDAVGLDLHLRVVARRAFRIDGCTIRGFHRDRVPANANGVRIEDAAPVGDVELPAMPGTAQYLPFPRVAVAARRAGQGSPGQRTPAQRRALVRTDVAQRVVAPPTLNTPMERAPTCTMRRVPGGNSSAAQTTTRSVPLWETSEPTPAHC